MYMRTKRMVTVLSGAAVVAAMSAGLVLPANAAEEVPDVTTKGLLVEGSNGSELTNLNPEKTSGFLACVPGKAGYGIAYRGELDMAPVVAKWKELKEQGRAGAQRLRPNWYGYDSVFNALVVSADFEISFKIDTSVVTTDVSVLQDLEAWKAAYAEANANSPFVSQMVINEAPGKGAQFDPATGKVSIFFKLKDGLTAGELDTTFADPNFRTVALNTLTNMLSVTEENYERKAASDEPSFLMTEAHVKGQFHAPRYVGNDFRLMLAIPVAFSGVFPVTFGQPASEPASVALDTSYTAKYSYEAGAGRQIPDAVAQSLPQLEENLVDLVDDWAKPAPVTVVNGENKELWTFDRWVGADKPVWSYDPGVAANDCFVRSVVGHWNVQKLIEPGVVNVVPAPTCGVPATFERANGATEGVSVTSRELPNGMTEVTLAPEAGYVFPDNAKTVFELDLRAVDCPAQETAKGPGVTTDPLPIGVVPPAATTDKPAPAPAVVKPALAKTGAELPLTAALGTAMLGAMIVVARRKR